MAGAVFRADLIKALENGIGRVSSSFKLPRSC